MTKIYIYCLFGEFEQFMGVYSSIKAVHRDALKICQRGKSQIYMEHEGQYAPPSLVKLRNFFKGKCDIEAKYYSEGALAKIYKTRLKE